MNDYKTTGLVADKRRDRIAKLEALGADAVRKMLLEKACPFPEDVTREWLATKDLEDAQAAESRREAREEEAISISRRADSKADRANRISYLAVAVAIVAIIASEREIIASAIERLL